MKKALLTLAVIAASVGIANAGDYGKVVIDKGPVIAPPVETGCDCFAPGAQLSLFAAGIFPDGGDFDDALGGGASLGYFFTDMAGIEISASGYSNSGSQVQNYTADFVLRYPITEICIAPYALVGGGVHTNSETEGLFRFGGGLDIRFPNCMGLFVDGTWNILGGDVADYAVARAGIRIPF